MAHALCYPGRPTPTVREILASPFAAGDGPPVTRSTVEFHAAKTLFFALYCLIRDVRNTPRSTQDETRTSVQIQ